MELNEILSVGLRWGSIRVLSSTHTPARTCTHVHAHAPEDAVRCSHPRARKRTLTRNRTFQTLFWTPRLQNCGKKINFRCWSHPAYDASLWQPENTVARDRFRGCGKRDREKRSRLLELRVAGVSGGPSCPSEVSLPGPSPEAQT